MNVENFMLILWLGIPVFLVIRFRWLWLVIGMAALWAVFCASFWPAWQPLRDPYAVLVGFIRFSFFWFTLCALVKTLFPRQAVQCWRRRLVLVVSCVLGLSLAAGLVDFCVASLRDGPILSKNVVVFRDGGTSIHVGFGYSLVYYRQLDGKRGPAVRHWLLPFEVCNRTETTGIRWIPPHRAFGNSQLWPGSGQDNRTVSMQGSNPSSPSEPRLRVAGKSTTRVPLAYEFVATE